MGRRRARNQGRSTVPALLAALALGLAPAACGGTSDDGSTAVTVPPPAAPSTGAARRPAPPPSANATRPPAPPPSTPARTDAPPRSQTDPARPDLPADLEIGFAGVGAEGAWVLRRRGERDDPVLLFLHGWTAVAPELYGPWLTHLVREGSTVVYPVYQDAPFLAPAVAFEGVVAGVRAALKEEQLPREDWVVAGHSAGGALSADYAARAEELGLPPAQGVFAAFPGRQIGGNPLRIPEADPAGIPATTRLVALYGVRDATVGDKTAKRTIARARADFEQLIRVEDPAVSDHLGPARSGPATRRVFWRRLDALIGAVRG